MPPVTSTVGRSRAGAGRHRNRITIGLFAMLLGLLVAWQTTSWVTEHGSTREEEFGNRAHTARLHAGQATVYSESPIPLSAIRITAPDGTSVPLRASRGTWVFAGSVSQIPSIAVFTAPESGVYTYQVADSVTEGTGLVVYQTTLTPHRLLPGAFLGLLFALPGLFVAVDRRRPVLPTSPVWPPVPLGPPPGPRIPPADSRPPASRS